MIRHGGGGGGREEPPGPKPHLLVWWEEGPGGRRRRHPGTPKRRQERGWGRDQAPTPGRGDEGSMGAKESRIGFLSYEEALRRGEGGGVWASCREGQRRAAQRVGDQERRGAGGRLRAWGA